MKIAQIKFTHRQDDRRMTTEAMAYDADDKVVHGFMCDSADEKEGVSRCLSYYAGLLYSEGQ